VTEPIRVLIADDEALIRAGFRVLIDTEPGMIVVGEAGDGAAAVELARQTHPHVVLMDIRMPGVDGLRATREIGADPDLADVHVLILTTFDHDEYVFEALRAGASGFLLKDAPPDELVHAIRVVAAGEALLAPSVTRRLIAEFARTPVPRADDRLARLTPRERDVLALVATGLSNAEIAARLFLGESTVKTHLTAVLTKLDLRDRVQAVVLAYESGLVRPGG
jgi:DNA-binding NarL/FixJ family response regulator